MGSQQSYDEDDPAGSLHTDVIAVAARTRTPNFRHQTVTAVWEQGIAASPPPGSTSSPVNTGVQDWEGTRR